MEPQPDRRSDWHGRAATDVARELGVDPALGLTDDDVVRHREEHGENRLAATRRESPVEAFLRQYRDFMQVVLLVAAVVNQVVTGEAGTTVVLVGLTSSLRPRRQSLPRPAPSPRRCDPRSSPMAFDLHGLIGPGTGCTPAGPSLSRRPVAEAPG